MWLAKGAKQVAPELDGKTPVSYVTMGRNTNVLLNRRQSRQAKAS
jgi:hypothetical protein